MGMHTKAARAARRQLVVIATDAPDLAQDFMRSDSGAVAAHVESLSSRYGAMFRPLELGRDDLWELQKRVATAPVPDGANVRFYQVHASDDRLETLQTELLKDPNIRAAYIKAPAEPAGLRQLNRDVVRSELSSPTGTPTPSFTSRQGYLAASPVGVDIEYMRTLPGGNGHGVRIVDCEWAWNVSHEELLRKQISSIAGQPGNSGDDNHGTAVIGAIASNNDGSGIDGIAPDSLASLARFPDDNDDVTTSEIIAAVVAQLSVGDIILLESHRAGPRSRGDGSQYGYLPIEWWPDDFVAIQRAIAKGIVVVEAGGNGSQDLDDPFYDRALRGFPPEWRNPFNASNPWSGAILVGAGNPPSGTHGRTQDSLGFNETYVDRSRCVYSNYGRRVDCQGWGWEVTTLGYGDWFGGSEKPRQLDHDRIYTDVFAGTSSASPIVAGLLACIQGALKAAGRAPASPDRLRSELRATGAPQQRAPDRPETQNIGRRPDGRRLISELLR